MKKDRTVQAAPPSQKQKGELDCAFIRAIPEVTGRVAQHLIGNQDKIAAAIWPMIVEAQKQVALQDRWSTFYRDVLLVDIGELKKSEFPAECYNEEHLLLHPKAGIELLFDRLLAWRKVELNGMSREEVLAVEPVNIKPEVVVDDSKDGSVYLLKILKSLPAEGTYTSSTTDDMLKFRGYAFDLREIMFYELCYGHSYGYYGPVPCAGSCLNGNEVTAIYFHKVDGLIKIYPGRRDAKRRLIWPSLENPLAFELNEHERVV